MRRHYLHGPSFQGEGFAPSRPLASSDRRTADGHIGAVLCVSGFSGLENSLQAVPASSSNRLPMLEAAASCSLDPDLVRRNILHAAGSSPPPSPARLKALEHQEEKAELLSPGNHGLTAAKSLLYILQDASRKRSNCSAHT